MLVCAAGDIHGAMDQMYERVLELETLLGRTFDLVLHVGDFGVWPDVSRLDRATVKRDGPGDFALWAKQLKAAPRPTVFIPGNHEDFEYLGQFDRVTEILPQLFYLPSGHVYPFSCGKETLRIGGVGGCYAPSDYERPSRSLQGKARRHYTRDQVERVIHKAKDGHIDVIMTHDAPSGVRVPTRGGRSVASPAQGLGELVEQTKPRVSLFGHHHARVSGRVGSIECIGLNCAPNAGSLVALDMPGQADEWNIVAEWP